MSKIQIKICCINSVKEANLAISAGASAIGLVSKMPSGPGVIEEDVIAEIAANTPPPIATFLLTSEQNADVIIEQHQRCKTNTIQLVDHLEINELVKLREQLIGIKLVQVIHVVGEDSIKEAKEIENYVDAILLDSGNQNLAVKELGGTGRTHNWDISKQIVEELNIPVFLAGGLKPENVSEAIEKVNPFGLDICSSVRTDGNLDPLKLEQFINAASNC